MMSIEFVHFLMKEIPLLMLEASSFFAFSNPILLKHSSSDQILPLVAFYNERMRQLFTSHTHSEVQVGRSPLLHRGLVSPSLQRMEVPSPVMNTATSYNAQKNFPRK